MATTDQRELYAHRAAEARQRAEAASDVDLRKTLASLAQSYQFLSDAAGIRTARSIGPPDL